MDVPNLQILGSRLFLLIVIYVGSHCCPTLGPLSKPRREERARGRGLRRPARSRSYLHRGAEATSHIHLAACTN